MLKVLFRARDRFVREQSGNVAILFAFSAIPLIGLLGGAVDAARHHRYKVELLNAMDSAAIALVRSSPESDAEADAFVNQFIAALLPKFVGGEAPARQQSARGSMFSMAAAAAPDTPAPASGARDPMLHMQPFDAVEIEGGWRVISDGYIDTAFLPVIGMDEMSLDLSSEVMMSGGKFEIALALDNTGSMAERNKIRDLREAANDLVDTLYDEPGAEDRVKMALIPFTHTVNIRGDAFNPSWLDPKGLGLGAHRFDSFDREVSRLDIFDAIGGGRRPDGLPAAWKGCVEARAGDLELDDTAPGDDPATRWTPYLSPDGADQGQGPSYLRSNSYLRDQTGGSALERLRNVDKYFRPMISARFNDAVGPNESCRGPIVELTNDRDRMSAAIEAMEPGGYTHIPLGLMWGWRVLSPEEPFSQGAEYDDGETQKALVLLSDGVNTVPGTYTAYGYLADGRLGSSERRAKQQLDANVTALCEKIKERNIRLYMILFQENDRETQRIFEECASVNEETSEAYYYYAPDGAALDAAFADIGVDLTSIRVSR